MIRCTVSFVFREMQDEAVSYHYSHIWMSDDFIPNVGKEQSNWNFATLLMEIQSGAAALRKKYWTITYKVKNTFIIWLTAIPLLKMKFRLI